MGLWKASRLPGRPVPADEAGRVRRPVVAGAGWVAAAVLATVIGLGGIRLVGDSLTGTPGGVLSQSQVDQALAEASDGPSPATESPATESPATESPATGSPATEPPAPASPSPTPSRTPAATTQHSFEVRGGTAIAACQGDVAYLLSWSPTQGYRVDKVERGPDDEVEVRFRADHARSEIKISCSGGSPVAEEKDDD